MLLEVDILPFPHTYTEKFSVENFQDTMAYFLKIHIFLVRLTYQISFYTPVPETIRKNCIYVRSANSSHTDFGRPILYRSSSGPYGLMEPGTHANRWAMPHHYCNLDEIVVGPSRID